MRGCFKDTPSVVFGSGGDRNAGQRPVFRSCSSFEVASFEASPFEASSFEVASVEASRARHRPQA